ncbi:uncharacterized protein LOC133196641 [Saccostrea echinata]|uniref:uncharacterized protein LOC133196641 n=1 Tax=Saccostrea echinata TaxID=191078 RepID=UPI002A80FA99|nr:uncharacterized protein LOC133196641 [Saccostrea echinata]
MLLKTYIFLFLMSFVTCSHFRGGSISWKPTSSPQQIEISYQMAWRRTYSGASCDDSKISSQGLITVDGKLYCRTGCNTQISSMHGKCIAYSSSENWSLGEGTFTFTLPTPGINYVFRMEQCCWQTLTTGASSKNVRMTMTANTAPRVDTGVINSSPVVTMAPIIRLLYNCPHTFRIPVIDADGDIVRCRFSSGSDTDECGYLCNGLSGSTIDKDTCMFSYNTTRTGTFGVHVQIEDFSTTAPATVLSSVPLQFLIVVFDDPLKCTDAPIFVDPTPTEGSCYVVSNTFTKILVARTTSASHTITKLSIMGPVGIGKSSLSPYGSSGREWSITVTWTPTQSQSGLHLLCFNAEINNKLTSSMICVDLLKGTPPAIELTKGCLTPLREIEDKLTNTLKMCFNRKFVRPTSEKFLIIHHTNGTVAHKLNLTDPAVASFPDSGGREVTVTLGGSPDSIILPTGEYYVLVESGAVAADSFSCTTDWTGISQPFFWNFTVVDLSPPVLNFTSTPSQKNSDEMYIMTWTVNEALSVEQCNLTTPTGASVVSCSKSFSSQLAPGNYVISIDIEDLSGNKAGPYTHQWVINDMTPPNLSFTLNPSLTKSNASITWNASEPVASSSCIITYPNTTKTNELCDGQWEAVDLPRGSYQISITLVDLVGLQGGPFLHTWTNIDVTPPILTFRRKPRRSLSKANITWVTNEVASGVCEIEGPSFYRSVVCDKGWSEDYLPEGNFVLNVTVYDESLNMAGPFQHKWYNRDVKPPELKFTNTPHCHKSTDNATITWTFNEFATSTCVITTSVQRQVFPGCDGSWNGIFLPEGNVTLEITARDKSRNSAPTYKYTWYNKDVTPPVLTFTRIDVLTINDAKITWSVNEPVSTTCTLTTPNNKEVFLCNSGTWSGSSMQGGNYKLSIITVDLGNNTAGPFVHNWRNVDTIRPRLAFSKAPSRTYSNATITWAVTEPVNSSCVVNGPANFYRKSSCDGGWRGMLLPPGSYKLVISVTDSSGNFGGPYVYRWINEDVTPPSLQWTGIPSLKTAGSMMLSWTTNEEVTSVCTVQSPVQVREVSCNNKWVGTELRNGEYSLTVNMVDGSGNKAQAIHQWNNTVKELVYEIVLTLSNVNVNDVANKTSLEYTKLVAESQTALENFYRSKVNNFKSIHIKDIIVVPKTVRRKRSTRSLSDISVEHDVVIDGDNKTASTAALSKTLSNLSSGGNSINIGGSTTSFSNVTLMTNDRTENVTFTRQTRACEIAQLYVTCSIREYCNEDLGMCVSMYLPDNNGMILSIGLGVSAAVVFILVTVIISLFYLRKKQEEEKGSREMVNEKKTKFEQPVTAFAYTPQIIYKPFKYWQ